MQAEHPQEPWSSVLRFLANAEDWVRRHEPELRALGTWGAVTQAAREARLYVPFHPEAWRQLERARRHSRDAGPDYEAEIVALYGPGGVGFDTLRAELMQAELLVDRRREVEEVLDSLVDGRHFVAVCGALPLVEYVLSKASGKWKDPRKHLDTLQARLHETPADEVDLSLFIEASALEMVLSEVPEIWQDGRQNVGAIDEKLNRHRALHGTALGWDDSTNATRAVLLLAAAARVAGPLLPPPAQGSH